MADKQKIEPSAKYPYFVSKVGDPDTAWIKAFANLPDAQQDADDRNARAAAYGVAARYEQRQISA